MAHTHTFAIAFMLAIIAQPGHAASRAGSEVQLGNQSSTLWQLPDQTHSQMMSYVIQTAHAKVIVIDGGMTGDAPFLTGFLKGLGGSVDAWFITHAHDDHFNALAQILRQQQPAFIQIRHIYASLPDAAWMAQWGDVGEKLSYGLFQQALTQAGRKVEDLSLGQTMDIDGVHIEVLGIKNPEITKDAVNNSSIVLRVSDSTKSVLFLGDLGLDGGEKLLKSPYADRLPSDYVQMAHHGQNGVGEPVYQKIHPSYCLWPTPEWLWNNDNGGGKGSGAWRTLEVRAWMEKMPIKKHYVMFEGIQKIE